MIFSKIINPTSKSNFIFQTQFYGEIPYLLKSVPCAYDYAIEVFTAQRISHFVQNAAQEIHSVLKPNHTSIRKDILGNAAELNIDILAPWEVRSGSGLL